MVPRLSRSVQTQRLTAYDQQKILNAQRALRPESPHLEIYQPQLTWYLSALHRVTGVAGAGILYLGALAYAFHPLYPVIDSAHAIEFIHNLPYWVKTAGKVALAAPVTFHSFNGIRHLMWDTGKGEWSDDSWIGLVMLTIRSHHEGCLHLWLRRPCCYGYLYDLPFFLRLSGVYSHECVMVVMACSNTDNSDV